MSLEINLVNLGTYPNDGSGDDLRTAFEKSNANFASLEANVVLSAVNVGNGAPLWLDKVGNNLRFRTIRSLTDNLSISFDSNEITLSIRDYLDKVEDDENPSLGGNLNLNGFEINGIGDVDITGVIIADGFEGVFLGTLFGDVFGNLYGNVTGNVTGQVSDLSNHELSSLNNVSTQTPSVNQALVWNGIHWTPKTLVNKIIAGENVSITPVEGTDEVTINVDVGNISPTSYDFGLLSGVRNQGDLVLQFTPVDFGSINNPSNVSFDLGFIDVVVPPPPITYQLSASSLSVSEGSTLIINLTTTGLDNGTVVPYIISGVSSDDINGTSLTGSFIINNGTSSLTVPITIDLSSESETLTLSLVGILPEVSISIDIEDFEIPDNIDGGSPSTTVFDIEFDGGIPTSTNFDITIDGGIIEGLGLIQALLDGGSPTSIPNVILDGAAPSTPITVVVNGGDLSFLSLEESGVVDGGLPITAITLTISGGTPLTPNLNILDGGIIN